MPGRLLWFNIGEASSKSGEGVTPTRVLDNRLADSNEETAVVEFKDYENRLVSLSSLLLDHLGCH